MPEKNILKPMGLMLFAMLMSGCTNSPSHSLAPNSLVPKAEYIDEFSNVAVVTTARLPRIKVDGIEGWSDSSAQAARAAMKNCFFYMDGCDNCWRIDREHITGELWLALFLTSSACTAVVAPVAAVVGAVAAPNAQDLQLMKESLSAPLSAQAIQGALRDEFMAAAHANGRLFENVSPTQVNDYVALASAGIDTVLEIAITDVSLKGTGVNPPLALTMVAHARLIRTKRNVEIFSDNYYYQVKGLKLSEWSANRAERLTHGLEEGYKNLASNIYDSIFLLYPYPDREFHLHAFGLAAVAPSERSDYATVESLQPMLRWESFPRPSDLRIAPKDMARVRDVRYDLFVARVLDPDYKDNNVVYRRNGLPDNEHKVEVALNPETIYTWSVRAHFKLDGRERVTEWSIPVETTWGRPYQFVTP